MERDKLNLILHAAMQAPSAGNQRPWEFIVIRKKETLKELSKLSPYAFCLARAPMAIVLVANEDRLKFPENWEQDMSTAAQNILLEAVNLGLGAVWLGIAPLEDRMIYVKEILKLQTSLKPFCAIPIGYPENPDANSFIDRFDPGRIHFESY